MDPERFWNSTLYEIRIYIEEIRNKEQCKYRDLHYLASLVREAVVSAHNPRVKVPSYDEIVSGGTEKPGKSNVHSGWQESKAFMKAIQNKKRR